jgi:hypothetical protein
MPRARLVDAARAIRAARARRLALSRARELRALAARVRRSVPGGRGKHLAALLSNGAWALEDLYGMHEEGEE